MAFSHDLVVIGGGAAGLTAAGIAVNLGAKTAMIEAERLGGDCTWTGCIPSKTLLHAAHVAHQSAHASAVGLANTPIPVDFPALMRHVRDVRQHVYEDADEPAIFEEMGIDVRLGRARLSGPHTVEITREDGAHERVSGDKIVVVTGARPTVPDIPGLAETPHLTSETLFEITEQPEHLAILGGGPIGTEMAQAFRRLGSRVTVVDRGDRILSKDDPELSAMLQQVLEDEGVEFRFRADAVRAEKTDAGVALTLTRNGREERLEADALLVAVGRTPNVDGLGLEQAGVAFSKKGIEVDDKGQTSVSHIYAAGDATGQFFLTHMSEHTAKTAVTNAMFKLPSAIDVAHVPWVTYTSPELAHVGATVADLDEKGTAYTTYRFPYSKVDRAVAEGDTTGLILVHATRTGRILGASVLGARAGDLIGEWALAMRNGVSLRQISDTIHPYPTYGLGVRRAADQWFAGLQSETVVRAVRALFRLRGPVNAHTPGRIV